MVKCFSTFLNGHGGPENLIYKENSLKAPNNKEVLVKIEYSGINFADIMSRQGLYTTRLKPPYVLGMEVSGVVEDIGKNASPSLIGKTVIGLCKSGGYSTYVNINEDQLFLIDQKYSDIAAAIPVNYLTAYFMIVHQANVKNGEWILIHGIGGGVGIAAMQIAKFLGAKIIGTASSGKFDEIRKFGNIELIDYRKNNFKDQVLEITDGRGADVILDPLGGKQLNESYSCLSEFGRLGTYGFSSAALSNKKNLFKIIPQYLAMPKFSPLELMRKNKTVYGFHLGLIKYRKDLVKAYSSEILSMLDNKIINPKIDKIFPLSKASDAHIYIAKRKNIGKILLSPNES